MISSRFIELDENDIPRLYYFEEVPTPINYENSNLGSSYIDDIVLDNLLMQLAPETSGVGWFSGLGGLLDDPRKLVLYVLGLIVLYAIVAGGGAI